MWIVILNFIMQKFLLCIIFILVGCYDGKTLDSTVGQSLYENENLVYDTYRFNDTSKGANIKTIDAVIDDNVSCVKSCMKSSLRIAIVLMNFDNPSITKEINNTLALIKASKISDNYVVKVIHGTDIVQQLTLIKPDIIVGPFKKIDLSLLKTQLHKARLDIPIISLIVRKNTKRKRYVNALNSYNGMHTKLRHPMYNLSYNVEDDMASMMKVLQKRNYQNYIMFAPNNDVGAHIYELFVKQAKKNKQMISMVEFYDTSRNDMTKHINRLKRAIHQEYYENIKNGKIHKNIHSFTKQIQNTKNDIVTLKNGNKYRKKIKTTDAIIIDASPEDFIKIFNIINKDKAFSGITLVGSSRIADAIISALNNDIHLPSETSIIFPSNIAVYRTYYEIYKNTFNIAPTRLSTTVYEAIRYILDVHSKSDIKDGLDVGVLPIFAGLNGTMMVNYKKGTTVRFVNISILENGRVKEIINTYKELK